MGVAPSVDQDICSLCQMDTQGEDDEASGGEAVDEDQHSPETRHICTQPGEQCRPPLPLLTICLPVYSCENAVRLLSQLDYQLPELSYHLPE